MLINEENLSQRIVDACNNIRISDLQRFCRHFKRQIMKCFDKTSFEFAPFLINLI